MWCSFLYSFNKPFLNATYVPGAGNTVMNKIQSGYKKPMTWSLESNQEWGQTYRQLSCPETRAVGPWPQHRGPTRCTVVGNLGFKEQKFSVVAYGKGTISAKDTGVTCVWQVRIQGRRHCQTWAWAGTKAWGVVHGPAASASPGSLLEMKNKATPQTYWIRISRS